MCIRDRFNSDYDTDGTLSGQNYLAIQDGDLTQIFGSGAWNENGLAGPLTDMHPGATTERTDVKPSYYAPNGNLRVCDGNFAHTNNVPTFTGINGKKVLAPIDVDGNVNDYSGNAIVGDSWISNGTDIEANPFVTVADNDGSNAPHANLIMTNAARDTQHAATLRNYSIFNTSSEEYAQATWGISLGYEEVADSGTWQPDTSTTYRFYATVIYDKVNEDVYQESHPKPFLHYPAQTDSSNNGLDSSGNMQFYSTAGETPTSGSTVGTGMSVFILPQIRFCLLYTSDAADE